MLTSCDRIPCKGYNIVVYRILDVLHLSRCVLTDISLNNLALTTNTLVVACNDAVIVVSVLRIIVEIVILLTRLDCAHLLNHFAVAHDLHLHVRGELSSVDSLRRSSEVDAHLERAVGSCSCRYLGDSIRCLQRVAHNRDVVKDKLIAPVSVTCTVETDVRHLVLVYNNLLLNGDIVLVGILSLRRYLVYHGSGSRLSAVLHFEFLWVACALSSHTIREIVEHASLKVECRQNKPVVVVDLCIGDRHSRLV